eukprot:1283224-Pyramimonas_sp.AAC.1
MQRGPATATHSGGEGAFNHDGAKASLRAKCAELRIRARGQHAATIEARNGVPRRTTHVMEEEFKRHNTPLIPPRLLHK